ncbi:hypothetical protein OBP_192 [Pseudomonas phage OBP]|uniref:hypothetical protein n=1 Tax=Pseudomonas phage OBP TaxID=1124849 RepID=UPI000240D5A0|nr:hypothetical protein OBP_192 [Pseudomonas phage OBP]AEV89629.1 hypothetical protein OBP_192 [Pseudomonas phage OBP]
MKHVRYLDQDLGTPLPPAPKEDCWDALFKGGLSKAKKIDLFYKLQSQKEASEGNTRPTNTIERRLIAKLFSRKAQAIWMNCTLRIYDYRNANLRPSEVDIRIINKLFDNHGAMIKAGTI